MFKSKMGYKPLFKLLSVLLCISILFTGGTITAFADAAKPDYSNLIVEELEQYRTEYSKTYLRNDGSLEAVVSSSPLHFKKLGAWVDYDNTLEFDEEEGIYKNKKAPFLVELPDSTNNKKEVVITKDGYTVELKLVGAKGVKSKKQEKTKATKAERKTMSAKEILNEDIVNVDKIKYEEIYDNTTIEYEVDSKSVKENIILNNEPKKAVSYTYQIRAEGMQIEKRTNGSIWFYSEEDTEKQNPIFYIPIPFMYDSNDEYSYDIETDLEIKNKKATLTYTPSFEWLTDSNRAYPVTIDPTVTMHNGIHDGYTYSYEPYGDNIYGFEDQLKVGKSAWMSECDYFETYIKFDNLPEFPENYHLLSSSIMITPKKSCGTWEEFIVGAYEITEDWQNVYTTALDSCLTYNNRPSASTVATSHAYFNFDFAGCPEAIDVTELTKAWYSGEKANNGVKLSMVNETNNAWDSMIYHSSRNAENAPYLSVVFEEGAEPLERIEIGVDNEHIVGTDPNHLMNIEIYPESSRYYYINDIAVTSSNENVARVFKTNFDPPYVLYALEEGTATITATLTSNPQFTDTVEFTVVEPYADNIEIILPDLNVVGEEIRTVKVNITPEKFHDELFDRITLTSSNPDVITVMGKNYTEQGFDIQIKATGTTTLTANVDDFTVTKEAEVYYQPVTDVTITNRPNGDMMHVLFNNTHQIGVELGPDNASQPGYYYESSNPGVATIDPMGNIMALSVGTTVISAHASHDNASDSFLLTVYDVVLDYEIPENNLINLGETFTVSTDPLTTISARTDGIISINGDGTITGIAVGATIVEVSYPNLDYFEEFEVVVTKDFVITGIPTGDIYPGATFTLGIEGEVAFSDTFVWYTSDSSIASITKNEIDGVVLTCHKPGDIYVGFSIGDSGIGEEVFFNIKAPKIKGVTLVDDGGGNTIYEDEYRNFWVHIETEPAHVNTMYMDIKWDFGNDFTHTRTEAHKCFAKAINASADQTNGTPITLTIEGQEYTFYRLVKRPTITITNAPTTDLAVGETYKLLYTITPQKFSNLEVVWSVTPNGVATISQEGVLTTTRAGTTTVSLVAIENPNVNTQFTLVVKDRRSYIFYTDVALEESPYLSQSNYSLSVLAIANMCYEGNTSFVEGIKFNNENEFVNAWNNIATNENIIIDYVFIISHGDFDKIFQTSYNEYASSSISISDVDSRLYDLKIKGIALISCNTGDIDQSNIATSFAKKINNAPLIAPDGYVTMRSNICIEGDFGDAKGWYIYIENNENINIIPTNEVQLMHEQLIVELKKYQ